MRRALLVGPGEVRVEDVPAPSVGPGEVLLTMELALAGGTVRKVVARGGHARMGAAPLALGHEGVGWVLCVGAGVTQVREGQRVVPSNSAACGSCAPCARGHSAQCAQMTWLTGTLAEQLLVPATIVRTGLAVVPPQLCSAAAALAENVACVLKGLDRTPVRAREQALVLGDGPMGLLWTHLLTQRGAQVTSVGRSEASRERARAMGATVSHAPEALAPGPYPADLIVEAVGTAASWELALSLARPGARVHLFGGPPAGTRISLDACRLHYEELTLTASFHHTPYHFAAALELLAQGTIPTEPLLAPETDLQTWAQRVGKPTARAASLPGKDVVRLRS